MKKTPTHTHTHRQAGLCVKTDGKVPGAAWKASTFILRTWAKKTGLFYRAARVGSGLANLSRWSL